MLGTQSKTSPRRRDLERPARDQGGWTNEVKEMEAFLALVEGRNNDPFSGVKRVSEAKCG